jgi:DNA-directed RNA polymerase subunit alpha
MSLWFRKELQGGGVLLLDIATPKVECIASNDSFGQYRIEPLEPGYGTTLGNALRRVLLSSLPGAAVTSIRVEGIYHEFSTLPHVREDVTQIVLNVKRVRLRSYAERPVKLWLQARGKGVVRAGDIECPSTVEIVNPDQVVATLDSDEAYLDMELTVERGRGYRPAESHENLPIGLIPVDAIFSPITKVNYVVERTRVGQMTDYDRLIMEVWSDSTISPGDALSYSAQVLVQYCALIAESSKVEELVEEESGGVVIPPHLYQISIDDLELGTRTHNCLKRAGITDVGQILEMDDKDLMAIRNLGEKSLNEIRERLVARGYLPQVQVPGVLLTEEAEETVDAILGGELALEEDEDLGLVGRPALPDDEEEEEAEDEAGQDLEAEDA